MDNNDRHHYYAGAVGLIDNNRHHWVRQNNGGNTEQNIRQTTTVFIGQPTKQRDGQEADNGTYHQRIRWDPFIKQQRLNQISCKERLNQTGVTRLTKTQPRG